VQGTDTLDQERVAAPAPRSRPGRSTDGWGGPEAVTVAPSPREGGRPRRRRTERGRRVLETRLVEPGAAFGDPPPPRDLPTVPASRVVPPPAEAVTIPVTAVPRPAPPATAPSRRVGVARMALLVLVLGLVVVTASHALGPATSRPAPPPPVAAPAPPAPAPPVDPAALDRTAMAAIDRLVQGDSVGHVSVAALDTATGRSFGYAADNPVSTASVVKLDILETLLLQSQEGETTLGSTTRDLAGRMIQQSDNAAATQLWGDLGGIPALNAANRRLGVRATTLDDHWGSTTTPASDQLRLLAALNGSSLLDADSRAFARDLMTRVADDQRWGVSAAADPGTTTALKNGWVPVDTAGGRWIVGSVGTVTAGGHPVLLAVLSEHQPSQEAGIRLVESMARIAAGAVTSRPEVVAAG
jgi:beta-lactamase class A